MCVCYNCRSRLYAAAGSFFDDETKHAVAVDERQLGLLDDRSGFIPSKRREMFELHGRSATGTRPRDPTPVPYPDPRSRARPRPRSRSTGPRFSPRSCPS